MVNALQRKLRLGTAGEHDHREVGLSFQRPREEFHSVHPRKLDVEQYQIESVRSHPPAALHSILGEVPASLGAPILIVQHIASGFGPGLANWLNSHSPLQVSLATEGAPLLPGRTYLAPEGQHLGVSADGLTVSLLDQPAREGFRPSADTLFESVASAFGPASAAVVLTGSGGDGVEGLRAIRDAHGLVIAQDEGSCVTFENPGKAVDADLVHAVLPLARIPQYLEEAVEKSARPV